MQVLIRALAAASAIALLCAPVCAQAQKLYDASLEKTTADFLAAHKAADVSGAMQAVMDQQGTLDRGELENILKVDAANHERALSELLSADPQFRGTGRLDFLITTRVDWLAGTGFQLDPAAWLNRRENLIGLRTTLAPQELILKDMVRDYERAGGHDFVDCDGFLSAHAAPPPGSSEDKVSTQCQIIALARAPEATYNQPVKALETGTGEFGQVTRQLAKATKDLKYQETERKTAKEELAKAKTALDQAKAAPTPQARVAEQLKKLDELLTKLDDEAGLRGVGGLAPGKALALVEFRKTNLREVIAATGSSEDTAAAKLNRAAAGVIAGIIRYDEADKAPSQAALTIALAHQTGLEAVVAVQMDSLKAEVSLLQEQREAALRELEYLAMARNALGVIPANTSCVRRPLAQVSLAEFVRNPACPLDARQSAARAISAYNMAWATGRAPARIADARVSQEIYMRKLRVTNQVIRARYSVQQAALQELADYGASGIKVSEVAAILQAIGVQAIAIGVN